MGKKLSRKPPSQRGNRQQVVKEEKYDPNNILYVATHEAGHAVASVIFGQRLDSVDVFLHEWEGRSSYGYTKAPITVDDVRGKGEVIMPYLIQTLAGPFAEGLVNILAIEQGVHEADVANARKIALMAFCEGTSTERKIHISDDEIRSKETLLNSVVKRACEAASQFADDHAAAITAVADALVKKRKLTGDEVASIVKASQSRPA